MTFEAKTAVFTHAPSLSPDDEDQVRELLEAVNLEFVPPLSARQSSTDKDLGPRAQVEGGVENYLQSLKGQSFVLAWSQEDASGQVELLGLLSYRRDHQMPDCQLPLPNAYVSTIGVAPSARGQGLATQLYEELFASLPPAVSVATRTWSTNDSHLGILDRFGFETLCSTPNDRGCGVDTVVLCKAGAQQPGEAANA